MDRSAEAIDHVGLRMEGYADFREKLDRLGIRYSPMDLPNFRNDDCSFMRPEARCWKPCFPNLFLRTTEPWSPSHWRHCEPSVRQ